MEEMDIGIYHTSVGTIHTRKGVSELGESKREKRREQRKVKTLVLDPELGDSGGIGLIDTGPLSAGRPPPA